MALRFTQTDKWRTDPWFRKLHPRSKLLFLYLCENCDIAGFWEIDIERAAFETGMDKSMVKGAIEGLSRCYEEKNGMLFLKNFIKHQRNLPFNENNAAHRGIIRLLESRKAFSGSVKQLLEAERIKKRGEAPTKGLPSPTSNSNSNSNSNSKGGSKGGKPDDRANRVAKHLIAHLRTLNGREPVTSVQSSSRWIMKLLKNGATEEELTGVLDWLFGPDGNMSSETKFVVASGKALYEKYDRIIAVKKVNDKPKFKSRLAYE